MPDRSHYPHFEHIATRWSDADPYGHVNDAQYYSYFDTAINNFLIRTAAFDLHKGPLLQFCAESHCKFMAELTFPEIVEAGLRVEHLGRSSVRYGIGLFRAGRTEPCAEGWVAQVFVDRGTRRPAPMTGEIRHALKLIEQSKPPEGTVR